MTAKKAAVKQAAAKKKANQRRRAAPVKAESEREMDPVAPVGDEVLTRESTPKKPAPSVARCGRYIQRQIAQDMPSICDMLLTETVEAKNLNALKMLLQLAVTFGGKPETPAQRDDLGFARKALQEFRLRKEATGG